MSFASLSFLLRKFFRQRHVVAQCGHQTLMHGCLEAYGSVRNVQLDRNVRKPPLCLDCMTKETIPCAWCGQAIFPGDPVTLYSPATLYPLPVGAVTYSEHPLRYVGCLRAGCADSGSDQQGFWIPPLGVQRVLSPIEQALKQDGPIITHDLFDQSQSILISSGEAIFIRD